MSTIEEIKSAIETLPPDDFAQLRQWFSEKDWDQWDKQIEEDSASGKLDFLAEEAMREKENAELKEL